MSEIKVYTKDGCPHCTKLLEELKNEGKAFKEISISTNAEELNFIKDKYNANKVPVLVDGEKVTIGYKGMG